MSVSLERASPHSLGFARDPMNIPSAQSDVAGNLGVAVFLYRADGSQVYAAPVRNGDAFTHLATVDAVNFRGEIEHQFADVGSYDVESDLGSGPGLRALAAWLAFAGVDPTVPLAGTATQEEYDSGGSWAAPSLSPGGGADDLNVSILMLSGYDGEFGDATGATIAPASGGGRTLAFDQLWEGEYIINRPRMLVMTAPGGTAMNWSITGAQPTYAHIAFTVKAAAAGGGDPALVVDEQPSATPSGYLIDPPPTVSMTTDGSTVDTSFTGDVTAELIGSGGVLLGTLTVAAVLGVAVFDDLRPCEAGSYTLRFSAAGVADLDSDPFTVTSGSGALVTGGDMPNVQLRRNEGTAALRRIYLSIEDEAGEPWAGSVTDVKAQLSQNGGSETDSPADIVRVGGGLHYVQVAQAYTDIAEGSKITARVPAASGRREAKAIGEIIPSDSYATAVNQAALVRALVRASLGFDGWIQRIVGEELELTEPGVGTAKIPVGLNGQPAVKALGATE